MKIQQKEIKKDLVQITTTDERWYQIGEEFLPSVTWILDSTYPKGYGFMQWIKQQGENADVVSQEARDRGSRVHHAIEALLKGEAVNHNSEFTNSDGIEAELTPSEYEAVISFADWFKSAKPEVIAFETTIVNKVAKYAGTVDLICKIDGKVWIIDFKTSKEVWPAYALQVSAYRKATEYTDAKMAILQIGYARNKSGYKFTEVEDKYDVFVALKKVWANEHGSEKPSQKDLPLSVKI